MRILIATTETQGLKLNDCCCVPEGEILIYPVIPEGGCPECNRGKSKECACQRTLWGINNHQPITTFRVTETPLNFKQLKELIRRSLYHRLINIEARHLSLDEGDKRTTQLANKFAKTLLKKTKQFPTGAVVERKGGMFMRRFQN